MNWDIKNDEKVEITLCIGKDRFKLRDIKDFIYNVNYDTEKAGINSAKDVEFDLFRGCIDIVGTLPDNILQEFRKAYEDSCKSEIPFRVPIFEDKNKCTCSSHDLFHFGCKCGYLTNKKEEL